MIKAGNAWVLGKQQSKQKLRLYNAHGPLWKKLLKDEIHPGKREAK